MYKIELLFYEKDIIEKYGNKFLDKIERLKKLEKNILKKEESILEIIEKNIVESINKKLSVNIEYVKYYFFEILKNCNESEKYFLCLVKFENSKDLILISLYPDFIDKNSRQSIFEYLNIKPKIFPQDFSSKKEKTDRKKLLSNIKELLELNELGFRNVIIFD